MKKLISLFALTVPLLCLGMEEPSNSQTNPENFGCFEHALNTTNIPLIEAFAHVGSEAVCHTALIHASKEVILTPEEGYQWDSSPKKGMEVGSYQVIAPTLASRINNAQLQDALVTAAGYQSLEKTKFLLEQYPEQFTQETLDRALAATLTAHRITTCNEEAYATLVRCPIFVPGHAEATRKNLALGQLLDSYGAKLSPEDATAALDVFGRPVCGEDPLEVTQDLFSNLLGLRSKTRCDCDDNDRDSARLWLIQHGAKAKRIVICCECCQSCLDAAEGIPLRRIKERASTGELLGYALGCLICLPCYAFEARTCFKVKEERHLAPPTAVPMDADPAPQPALLTKN